MGTICPGFSLRTKLTEAGLAGSDLTDALVKAHALISSVPELTVRRYNPLKPMQGVHEG